MAEADDLADLLGDIDDDDDDGDDDDDDDGGIPGLGSDTSSASGDESPVPLAGESAARDRDDGGGIPGLGSDSSSAKGDESPVPLANESAVRDAVPDADDRALAALLEGVDDGSDLSEPSSGRGRQNGGDSHNGTRRRPRAPGSRSSRSSRSSHSSSSSSSSHSNGKDIAQTGQVAGATRETAQSESPREERAEGRTHASEDHRGTTAAMSGGGAEDVHTAAALADLGHEDFGKLWEGWTSLSLKDNKLTSLSCLGDAALPVTLTTLSLQGNEFADVDALAVELSRLVNLKDLDISRCRLRRLPVLQGLRRLTRLDAHENMLCTSRGLLQCTGLRWLSLAHNKLRRLEEVEMLQQLDELDLSYNQLGPTPHAALRAAAACSHIRVLHICGNPLAQGAGHWLQLANLFPSLVLIDDRKVRPLHIASRVAPQREGIGYGLLARGSPVRRGLRNQDSPGYSKSTQSSVLSSAKRLSPTHSASTSRLSETVLDAESAPTSPNPRTSMRRSSSACPGGTAGPDKRKPDVRSPMQRPAGYGTSCDSGRVAPRTPVTRQVCAKSRSSPGPLTPAANLTRARSIQNLPKPGPKDSTGIARAGARPTQGHQGKFGLAASMPRKSGGSLNRVQAQPRHPDRPESIRERLRVHYESRTDSRPETPSLRAHVDSLAPGAALDPGPELAAETDLLTPLAATPSSSLHARVKDILQTYNEASSADAAAAPEPQQAQPAAGGEAGGEAAGEAWEDDSPSSVDATLNELLEEKRRLLCRVSAKLGETVVSSILGGGGPLDVSDSMLEAARGQALVAPAARMAAPAQPFEPPARRARAEPDKDAGVDLQSLCLNLRSGIERKRALLSELQQM